MPIPARTASHSDAGGRACIDALLLDPFYGVQGKFSEQENHGLHGLGSARGPRVDLGVLTETIFFSQQRSPGTQRGDPQNELGKQNRENPVSSILKILSFCPKYPRYPCNRVEGSTR